MPRSGKAYVEIKPPEQVTEEEIQRVRRHECKVHGHSFEFLQFWQHEAPSRVVCSNCGKSWRVVEEDVA